MEKGTEFIYNGIKYAMWGYTPKGDFMIKNLENNKFYGLKKKDVNKVTMLDTKNQQVLDEIAKEHQEQRRARQTVASMERNQYFIGEDGNKHIFEKMNNTRFIYRNERGKFTNVFKFIKEPLNEYASGEPEEHNMKTFREGQVFIGIDDKKYVFFKMKRTRAITVLYTNHDIAYDTPNSYVKELVDEIVVFSKCKKCGMPTENAKGDEDRLCDTCCELFMPHTRYSEL